MEEPLGLPRVWNQVGCSPRCRLQGDAHGGREPTRSCPALGARNPSASGPPPLERRLVCTFAWWMRFINRFVPIKCADADTGVPCALTRWRTFRLQVTRSFGNLTEDAGLLPPRRGAGEEEPQILAAPLAV